MSWACQIELENRDRPGPIHSENQLKHRGILVDWLFEVFQKFSISIDAQLATIALLDRSLAAGQIPSNQLQIVGVACCYIACSYTEVAPPEIYDFVWIARELFSDIELCGRVRAIFAALDYNITAPTSLVFYRLLGPHSDAVYKTGAYIILLMAVDGIMGHRVAIAALCISQALHTDGTIVWPDRLTTIANADQAFSYTKEIVGYMTMDTLYTKYFKHENKMFKMPLVDYIISDHRANWSILLSKINSDGPCVRSE